MVLTHDAHAFTKHSQNTCKTTRWHIGAEGSRPRSSNASTDKTRTKHTREHETTIEKSSAPPIDLISSVRTSRALKVKRWREGRRDGGTDGPHKFVWRALATLESSRARSFARSHARTQRNRNRNRNRFPGSGVGLTSLSLPPTSDCSISFNTAEV